MSEAPVRKEKKVSATRVQMTELMTPNHANFLGKVFGGSILSLLDLAAYTTASRFAENVCVTASFDRVDFLQPIEVGELVTMIGSVSYVGRTSVEVTIEVYAEDIQKGSTRHTNTAHVTMVAIDAEGKPVTVPKLVCETRGEKLRFLEGRLRRELRGRQNGELETLLHRFARATHEELDTLLEAENLLSQL